MVRIIGVTGYTGVGKTTFIQFLRELTNYSSHSLSDAIRDELEKEGKEVIRDNLIWMGNELRKKKGHGVLAQKIVEKISGAAIVDSIKNPEEVEELRNAFGENFFLINLTSEMRSRFERTRKRNREKDPVKWEDFVKLEEAHSGVKGEHSQRINDCELMADFVIINDAGLGELKSKARALVGFLQ